MNTNNLPPVGSRAAVASVETVAEYCHNRPGTVTEHRHSATAGCTVAVLVFDEPLPRHWNPLPLKSLGLRADQIRPA